MFADILKRLRTKQQGLTQAKFAEILGVSQQAVGLWERGKNMPSKELLVRIADYFGVTVDYMVGRPSTASELWRSIVLSTHFEPSYLAIQLGIPASEMSYLEHQKDDKVSEDTRSKLIGLYQTLNSQVKVGWNKAKPKASVPDVYNLIEDNDSLRYKGEDYDLDETTKEKLHTAVKLVLM